MIDIPDNELEFVYHLALKKWHKLMPDIVSDTIIRMIRYHNKYDPSKGARTTWIYAIMQNVAFRTISKIIRDDAKAKIFFFDDIEIDTDLLKNTVVDNHDLFEYRYDVNQIKYKLTGRQREFIDLVMAGLTIEDIAHILNMTNRKSYFELEKRTRINIQKLLNI